jgi:hypothetical protein
MADGENADWLQAGDRLAIGQKKARHEALQINASDPLSGIRRQRVTAPRSHPPKTLTA